MPRPSTRSFSARDGDTQTPDVDAVVSNLLGQRADALREKHLRVEHAGTPGVALPAPQRVLNVIIGNLLRAATQFADGGTLRVQVSRDALLVAHGLGADAHVPPPRSDNERVLGLGMIRRVCERWGWALDESSGDSGERSFLLRFDPAGAALAGVNNS